MAPETEPIIDSMLAAIAAVASGNLRARVDTPEDAPASLKNLADGVNQLIGAWRTSELQSRKTKRALEAKIAAVEAQAIMIRELSTPILQIWHSVLLLPIVGEFDENRAQELTSELLTRLVRAQAEHVIIDITGIDHVEEQTADHFLRLVRSARLLGAQCVLTGVSPAVAQMLVNIGANLAELTTLRTLEDGLMHCMQTAAEHDVDTTALFLDEATAPEAENAAVNYAETAGN